MQGNLAPESAVLKLSGKDIAGVFRGPVSNTEIKYICAVTRHIPVLSDSW